MVLKGLQDRRPHLPELARALLAAGLLVGCYYLVPVEPELDRAWRIVRTGLTAAAVAVLALVIVRMVIRLRRDQPGTRPANLLVALVGGVVLFALVDYQVAVSMPGQFANLHTKTDALYFAVSTLTTVGYGDIHAAGQVGRAVVIGQQVFNLAVLATGGSVLISRLRSPDR